MIDYDDGTPASTPQMAYDVLITSHLCKEEMVIESLIRILELIWFLQDF